MLLHSHPASQQTSRRDGSLRKASGPGRAYETPVMITFPSVLAKFRCFSLYKRPTMTFLTEAGKRDRFSVKIYNSRAWDTHEVRRCAGLWTQNRGECHHFIAPLSVRVSLSVYKIALLSCPVGGSPLWPPRCRGHHRLKPQVPSQPLCKQDVHVSDYWPKACYVFEIVCA